jgi:hypothetical protein
MKKYQKLQKWDGKTKLKFDEFLLKVRDDDTGFATKLTKKGEVPKSFENWVDTDIYVLHEIPRSGWRIQSYRAGESRSWATVRHPFGFTLEIYLDVIFSIIRRSSINRSLIKGEFAWRYSKLIEIVMMKTK